MLDALLLLLLLQPLVIICSDFPIPLHRESASSAEVCLAAPVLPDRIIHSIIPAELRPDYETLWMSLDDKQILLTINSMSELARFYHIQGRKTEKGEWCVKLRSYLRVYEKEVSTSVVSLIRFMIIRTLLEVGENERTSIDFDSMTPACRVAMYLTVMQYDENRTKEDIAALLDRAIANVKEIENDSTKALMYARLAELADRIGLREKRDAATLALDVIIKRIDGRSERLIVELSIRDLFARSGTSFAEKKLLDVHHKLVGNIKNSMVQTSEGQAGGAGKLPKEVVGRYRSDSRSAELRSDGTFVAMTQRNLDIRKAIGRWSFAGECIRFDSDIPLAWTDARIGHYVVKWGHDSYLISECEMLAFCQKWQRGDGRLTFEERSKFLRKDGSGNHDSVGSPTIPKSFDPKLLRIRIVGKVLRVVAGKNVRIDLGSDDGVRVGTLFRLEDDTELLLYVEEGFAKSSSTRVVSGCRKVAVGEKVIPIH